MLSAFSAMIPSRAAALHTAGLLVAFAAGWFLKPAVPAPVPETSGQTRDGANRKTALPTSLAGRPVGTAGVIWLDAVATDAAEVRGAARPGEVNQVLLEKLEAVLAMPDPAERQARWTALLPLMRLEDGRSIRDMLRESAAEGRVFSEETTAFWRRCGWMDPVTALSWAEDERWNMTSDVLCGWASRDGGAAFAWFKVNLSRADVDPNRAPASLVTGLAAQSPEAATGFLLANGDDMLFRPCLRMAAGFVIQRDGITAAWQWFTALAETDAPAPFKAANLEALLSNGEMWLSDHALEMKLARTAVKYAGEPWFSGSSASNLGMYMGKLDPVAGAGVMEIIQNAEARRSFTDMLLREWLSRNDGSLEDWLQRNRASPSFDVMASKLATHLADKNPEAARGWAEQISDPAKKEALEKELSKEQEPAPESADGIQ